MTMEGRHSKPLQRAMGGGVISGVVRIEVNEWAEIRELSPDSTFNYNGAGVVNKELTNGVTVSHSKLVLKFESRIPSFGVFSVPCYLAVGFAGDMPQIWTRKTHAASLVRASFFVQPIKTDFTVSTVTWNNIPASSGVIGTVSRAWCSRVENPGSPTLGLVSGSQRGVVNVDDDPDIIFGMFASGGIENAYGMVVYPGDFSFPVNTWRAELNMIVSGGRAFFQYGS